MAYIYGTGFLMNSLITIAIWNAGIASLLACVAYLVGRKAKSAAVGHVLWILVLLKLVTPPIFEVPLHVLPASKASVTASTPIGDSPTAQVGMTPSQNTREDIGANRASGTPLADLEESLPTTSLVQILFGVWLLGAVLR